MSTLLAFFEPGEYQGGHVLRKEAKNSIIKGVNIQPTLIVKNGMAHFPNLKPIQERQTLKWTTL